MTRTPRRQLLVSRLVVAINATIQVGIGLTGIAAHLLMKYRGQHVDTMDAMCFVAVTLSGSNTLTQIFDSGAK